LGRFGLKSAALIASTTFALCAPPANSAPDDGSALSGYWALVATAKPAPPVLTPWARRQMRKVKTRGDIDIEAVRWCVTQGMPYVMDNSGPIEIRRAPHEFALAAEGPAMFRHIYTDRTEHLSAQTADETVVGDSLGQWKSGVLTVDTTKLNNGVGPAGAPRTESSHVTEVFRLVGDGSRLRVTTQWTDPKVFVRPYRYTLTYRRLPSDYTPVEYYCDPRDNGVGHDLAKESRASSAQR
jgi:hypothetical protein